MTSSGVLDDVSFCRLTVGVTDMDRALAFYRDVIGMEVVFETLISGGPFDAVPHATRKQEGYTPGTPGQEPFEISGVRTFFVKDPDGTPVEFIELPGGSRSTYEMHRDVPLQLGPAKAEP